MKNKTMAENIKCLEMVVSDEKEGGKHPFISCDYILEKLKRIREGTICFHPNIIKRLRSEK